MDPKRTYHASQAVHMSDLLNLRFAKERFGTERPRYLRVREPDGPSTSGGRTARQAITLIDFQEDQRSTLVCGFIDSVNKKAELRSYPMVKHAFENRFNVSIDISRTEYQRMMDMLQDFMAGQGIETRLLHERPIPPPPVGVRAKPRTTARPRFLWPAAWVLIGFAAGFCTCYALARMGYVV